MVIHHAIRDYTPHWSTDSVSRVHGITKRIGSLQAYLLFEYSVISEKVVRLTVNSRTSSNGDIIMTTFRNVTGGLEIISI